MRHVMSLTHQSLASGGVDDTVDQIQDAMDAGLVLSSTGGTITADGTEQTLVIISEPLGCWKPLTMFVDLDNMLVGDTVVLRCYYRIADGGALLLWDAQTFSGIDGSLANGCKITGSDLLPNRHGFQFTIQQTAGTNRAYAWEFFAEV